MFTKVLSPVIGLLRELGIRCVIYLEDILMNQDKELACQQTWAAIDLLESLGFLVNYYNKSILDPVQEIVFLGFVLIQNSIVKVRTCVYHNRSCLRYNRKHVSSSHRIKYLQGQTIGCYTCHLPCPLHYCSLEQLKHKALRVSGFNGLMTISSPAQEDLE